MAISESELLLKFARELREVVESFEEEAEIFADRETVREIEESKEAYNRGEVIEFKNIKEFRRAVGL